MQSLHSSSRQPYFFAADTQQHKKPTMQSNLEILPSLIEARAALLAGHRNPPVIELSRDPREATAYALAVILGDDTVGKREALDQLV